MGKGKSLILVLTEMKIMIVSKVIADMTNGNKKQATISERISLILDLKFEFIIKNQI